MKRAMLSMIGFAAIVLLAAGCGVESGTNPAPGVTIGLAVSFDLSTPTVAIPGNGDTRTTSGPDWSGAPDSVTVTSGLLMVRSVRLNENAVTQVDTVITAADEDRDIGDASVRFKGPYVVEIGGSAFDLGTTTVPAGVYRQMTFVLQKARTTDDLGGHEELAGSSISVTGKVWRGGGGESFVFETDYTSEFAITGDFTVGESVNGTLTIEFAPGGWFLAGSTWLDPEDSASRLRILRNVRRNISGAVEVDN